MLAKKSDGTVYTGHRVFRQFADLVWVDFDVVTSTVCLILLMQIGFRQKWLSNQAR